MPTIYIGGDGAHVIHDDGYDEAINYPDPTYPEPPLPVIRVQMQRAAWRLTLAGMVGISAVLVTGAVFSVFLFYSQ